MSFYNNSKKDKIKYIISQIIDLDRINRVYFETLSVYKSIKLKVLPDYIRFSFEIKINNNKYEA